MLISISKIFFFIADLFSSQCANSTIRHNRVIVLMVFCLLPYSIFAQDVIKPFDKSRVQAEFFKRCIESDALIRPSEYNPGSPYYSGYKKQKIGGSNIVGLYGLKEPVFFMFTNRNHPERMENKGGIASESLLRLFEMTKGDFVVVYVRNTSMYAENIEGGLYTFDYQGNKIDSLLLYRSYHCRYEDHSYISYDLVSELNQDFSVKMTYIHWYQNEQITNPETPYFVTGTFAGQRFEEEHTLSSDGHFRITRRTTYSPKMYSPKDLRQYAVGSKINDPSLGIHHGTESVVRQETYNNVLSNSVSLYNGLGKVVKLKSAYVKVIGLNTYEQIMSNKFWNNIPWTGGQCEVFFSFSNIVMVGESGKEYVFPGNLSLDGIRTLLPNATIDISINKNINDAFEIDQYKKQNWDMYLTPNDEFYVNLFRQTPNSVILSACDNSEIFGCEIPKTHMVHTVGFKISVTIGNQTSILLNQDKSEKCSALVQMYWED